MRCTIVALTLAACTSSVEGLEAPRVTGSDAGATVEVAVTGDDRDYALDADGFSLEVHTPTAADLHALAGRPLTFEPGGGLSWRAADAEGPAWLVSHQADPAFAEVWFGSDFATFGEVIATRRSGRATDRYHEVLFQTDDGVVALVPGDVVTAPVGGAWFRIGLVGAYEHDDRARTKCPTDHELLSYELLRVDGPEASEWIERPEGLEGARGAGGC